MPLDDFLEFEDDPDENTEPVAEAPADVPEILQPDVADEVNVLDIRDPDINVVPAAYVEHEDDGAEGDYDDGYDYDEPEATGAVVTISIDVDPATVNDGDIPQFGLQLLETGLGDMFGAENVEFLNSQPGDDTWDITFRIDPNSPSFGMAGMLRSGGRVLIRPRLENGEITGDILPANTTCDYTYN